MYRSALSPIIRSLVSWRPRYLVRCPGFVHHGLWWYPVGHREALLYNSPQTYFVHWLLSVPILRFVTALLLCAKPYLILYGDSTPIDTLIRLEAGRAGNSNTVEEHYVNDPLELRNLPIYICSYAYKVKRLWKLECWLLDKISSLTIGLMVIIPMTATAVPHMSTVLDYRIR